MKCSYTLKKEKEEKKLW